MKWAKQAHAHIDTAQNTDYSIILRLKKDL